MWELYLKCFAVAGIGMALQTVLKMKSINVKAKAAGIPFKPSDYFKEDWLSIIASILTILMFLFFISDILHFSPNLMNYSRILFAFVGYTGSDIASRLFSEINRRINNTIDEKTEKL